MLIFAHRGASADAPENTLLAIEEALTQGADGIEIDVHQSGDDLVVIHDRWLHHTTNGQGQLQDYCLTELKLLDAGQGQQIPTLWQVMQLVDGRCLLNIEIKGVNDPQLVLSLIDKAQRELHFFRQQFIVSSFDHHLLKDIKALSPSLKIAALTTGKPIDYALFAQNLDAYSVNIDMTFIDQHFVADAKSRGLKIFVYTVDEEEDLLKLIDLAVDGVFCNAPGRARRFLNQSWLNLL
ncbi:MAG: glycerophosphoryl diester phosphodiesterase [Paraglaciecola sp.]|jgi:glycerophosphoryl diester phosphodiesterase